MKGEILFRRSILQKVRFQRKKKKKRKEKEKEKNEWKNKKEIKENNKK